MKLASKRMRFVASAALLFAFAAACGENPIAGPQEADDVIDAVGDSQTGTDPSAPATDELARIRILLTDAPADYIGAATVDIGRVTLVPADDGEHVVLSEDGTDGFVNLLDFQGAATTPIAEAEIEPGTFGQIRMVVEAARVELIEGYTFRDGSTEMELTVPSGAQSGLKLNLHNEEDGGPVAFLPGESVLVLDFDVNQSFVLRGNPDTPAGVHGVNFKPAIRVTAMDVAASVSGVVSTAAEGVSVEGLTVVATPTDGGTVDGYQTYIGTAVTGEDGGYTIHFLVPGSYDVTVNVGQGLGTEPVMTSVVLDQSEDLTGVDFEVIDITGSVAGTVSTAVDGVSVEGLTVSALLDSEGAEPITTETGSDGTYLFDGILAGTYTVSVAVADGLGTNPVVAEVTVAPSEDVTGVDFEVIDITGSVAGTVSTALDGVSVEGLTVSALLNTEGAEPITTETGSDGTYLFDGILAGTYTVSVAVADGQLTDPVAEEVEVGAGEDVVGVDFAILEDLTGTISGAVSTVLDGVSVEGLTVSALSDADGAEPITAVTGADGTFIIESVPAGTYTVTVAVPEGFTTFPPEIVAAVEEKSDVTGLGFQIIIAG